MILLLKQTMSALLAGILLLAGVGSGTVMQTGVQEEFRAMWVASIYNLDYPSKATTDPQKLKNEADEILKGCADMGMNAVILQVRPSGDALYKSSLFPWSKYLTGTQGTAPAGGFDPLAYWVQSAHDLGLELHAWINPFRITKGGEKEFAALSADSPAVRHPDWVVKYDGNYYFNPGLAEVRELVIQGAEELARNYDIDGIHLDDYFYPGSQFDDGAAFGQYGQSFQTIGDWRRYNVNLLVKTLGERLHQIDPAISYGISPSGVWADKKSLPEGSNTTGGYESYYASYADSRKWVKEGWIDYICPQIYWVIGHKSMDYATIARWWADTVRGTGVKLYIGMADYQAGNKDQNSAWYGTGAIEKQLALNDKLPEVAGEAHFRYQLIAKNGPLVALYRKTYAAAPSPPPTPTPPPQTPYLDAVAHKSYMEGSGGYFRPDEGLSRAEAVTVLARLSVDEDGGALYTGAAYQGGFSDVQGGAWHAPYIAFARAYGIADGYQDGTFRPDAPVSRAELVKLVAAYFAYDAADTETGFSDVPRDHWAAAPIAYAEQSGWLDCFSGPFQPEKAITRAETVTVLNRAMGRAPDVRYLGDNVSLNRFVDLSDEHWAYYDIIEATVTHAYDFDGGGETWQ